MSRHETGRDGPGNWRLFLRINHGKYIINPQLRLRCGEKWVAIYDLLGLPELGFDIRKIEYLTDAEFMDFLSSKSGMVTTLFLHSVHGRIYSDIHHIHTASPFSDGHIYPIRANGS
ncbi:hypothetical protein NDG12_004306 [Salmonella enterica]|nr:hypothetical protein [Salmonella enterica]